MTQQQVFDRMVAHLAEQKRRCFYGGSCLYRGPNGMKCIIGSLISDASVERIASVSMLSATVLADEVWGIVKYELALEDMEAVEAAKFYRHMQRAHDNSKDLKGLKDSLKGVAKDYGLKSKSVSSIKEWSREAVPA